MKPKRKRIRSWLGLYGGNVYGVREFSLRAAETSFADLLGYPDDGSLEDLEVLPCLKDFFKPRAIGEAFALTKVMD